MITPQASVLQTNSVHVKPEQMDLDQCAAISSLVTMHVERAVAGTRIREGSLPHNHSLESHSSYYSLPQQSSSMISTPATSPAFVGRDLTYALQAAQGTNNASGVVVTLPDFHTHSSSIHAVTPIPSGLYSPSLNHQQMINIQSAIKPQTKRRRCTTTATSGIPLRRTKDGGISKSRSYSFSHHQQHVTSRSAAMTAPTIPFPSSVCCFDNYRHFTSSPPSLLPSPLPSPPSSTASASSMMDIEPTQMTDTVMNNFIAHVDHDQNLPSPSTPPSSETIFIPESTHLSPKPTLTIKRESPQPSLLPNTINPVPRGSQPSKGKKQSNSGHGSAQAPSIAHLASLTSHEPVTSTRNGIEWVNFYYSHNRVLKQYSVRVDIDKIELSTIPEEFKVLNCVYPRANLPRHSYAGNRWAYETDCNALGWRLAYLNRDEIAGKRGLIQRAVDSYRNRYPSMRSRRVARQEKLVNGTLRKRKGRDGDPHATRGTHHVPGLPNVAVHAAPTDLAISTEESADDIVVKSEPQDTSASPSSSANSDVYTYSAFNDELNYSKSPRRPTLPLLAPAPPKQQEPCYVLDPTLSSCAFSTTTTQDSITKLNSDYQTNESKQFYEYQKTLEMKESAPIFRPTISCSPEEQKVTTNMNETMPPWSSHVRIKINVDDVNLDDIDEEFRRANCVYPHAARFINGEMNYQNSVNSNSNDCDNKRIKSELEECNVLGWKLAWLNPQYLANKKIILQRALDLYRTKYAQHLFPRRASIPYRCNLIAGTPSKVWNLQMATANAVPSTQISPSITDFSNNPPFDVNSHGHLASPTFPLDQGLIPSGQTSLSLNPTCPQQNDPPGTPDYDALFHMHDDEENIAKSVSIDNPSTTSFAPNSLDYSGFQLHIACSTQNNNPSSNFSVHRDSGFSEASMVAFKQQQQMNNETIFSEAVVVLEGYSWPTY